MALVIKSIPPYSIKPLSICMYIFFDAFCCKVFIRFECCSVTLGGERNAKGGQVTCNNLKNRNFSRLQIVGHSLDLVDLILQ